MFGFIWLAYNLIRLIMAQSALIVDVLPRTLSFNTLSNFGWPGAEPRIKQITKILLPDYWPWWLSSLLVIDPDELSREQSSDDPNPILY